jgi:hypothetical protein
LFNAVQYDRGGSLISVKLLVVLLVGDATYCRVIQFAFSIIYTCNLQIHNVVFWAAVFLSAYPVRYITSYPTISNC